MYWRKRKRPRYKIILSSMTTVFPGLTVLLNAKRISFIKSLILYKGSSTLHVSLSTKCKCFRMDKKRSRFMIRFIRPLPYILFSDQHNLMSGIWTTPIINSIPKKVFISPIENRYPGALMFFCFIISANLYGIFVCLLDHK